MQIVETVRRNLEIGDEIKPPRRTLPHRLEALARATVASGKVALSLMGFLSEVIAALAMTLLRPRWLRLTSVVRHRLRAEVYGLVRTLNHAVHRLQQNPPASCPATASRGYRR